MTEITFDEVKQCLGDQTMEIWLLKRENERLRAMLAERITTDGSVGGQVPLDESRGL